MRWNMPSHATWDRASFVFGDLDFEPLLFSLNRFGVTTAVWFERDSTSTELLEAADWRHQITVRTCWELADATFRPRSLEPTLVENAGRPETPLLGRGIWRGRRRTRADKPARLVLSWTALGIQPA